MAIAEGQGPVANIRHTLRALRGRNYALFFIGQGLSLVGTWMQSTAMGWLIYSMTRSKELLGWVAFAGQIPSLLVSPLAGVLSDRWNRHRVLLITQALAMVQAGALAGLAISGQIAIWHILALAACLGLVMAVDIPNRQAFVSQMVDRREDLPNAIALNSLVFHAARLIGPAIAGFVITHAGEGMCFLANAVSYLAVIAAVLAMRIPRAAARADQPQFGRELHEGLLYAYRVGPIRYLLVGLTLLGVVALPYSTLFPVFARDILGGEGVDGPVVQGMLLSSAGLGAMLGAIYLASRRSILGLGTIMSVTPLALGAGLIGFGISRWLWASLASISVVGASLMILMGGCNTMLQTLVDDDKRGRVMSLYALAFIGSSPFGALLAGYMAKHLGAPVTMMLDGAVVVAACILFLPRTPRLRDETHAIYERLGILAQTPPQTATPPLNGSGAGSV